MNPLLTLWLLVVASAIVLAGIFYLAENYSHIVGNFYVLLGFFIGAYILYALLSWIFRRRSKKTRHIQP